MRRLRLRNWITLALVVAALSASTGNATATPYLSHEQQTPARTGSVSGRVTEADGTPLPGVIVLLRGPAPATEEQITRVGADANFLFTALRPGVYRLAVELPGLSAPGDVEVTVTSGQRVETAIELSLFAYEVNVDVIARVEEGREIVRGDSTSGEVNLPSRILTELPLFAEQALEALPVFPGMVQGPTGMISIGGTLPNDSTYLFNGADLLDPFNGGYNMRVPLEAVDNVGLQTGVYPASYGEVLGGVVDLTTRPGGDQWDFELSSIFPRPWFKDGGIRGIRRWNPRLRFSGPMAPDKLFISQALEYRFNRDRVYDVPDDSGDNIRTEGIESLTQIDWHPNDRQRYRFMLLAFPEQTSFVGLNGLTPLESTTQVNASPLVFLVDNQTRLDERSFLSSMLQFNSFGLDSRAELANSFAPLVLLPEQSTGPAMNRQDRQSQHWQIKSAYTRALGPVEQPRHLLEVGGEVHYLSLDGSYRNRPVEVRGEAGQLLRSIEFRGGERLNSDKFEWALFAQDRFRPSQRFWVDLGLRVSDDQATDGVQLAPRLGIAWDLFGGSGTLLKASAGVLFRRILMAELAWERLPTRIGTRFSSGAGDEVVVLTPRLSDDLDSPRAVLGTIELSHRFNDRLTARVRYSYRDSRKQLVFDAVDGLGPAADVGMPPGSAPTASLLLSNAGSSLYRELVLAANLRLGRHDQMFFSYTWSSTEGDLNDPSLLSAVRPDPVLRRNQRAALRFDTPHRIVVWGTLNLPWDIIAAPVIEWRKGFPWSVLAEDQTYLGSANTERFPTYFRADVNITKGFRIRGYALRMGVLLQNFTTHFNPRDVIANVASPRFGELLNSERLRVRLRFSASF